MSDSEINLSIIPRHNTQSSNTVRKYSDIVPDDLLIEIFSRVPAKSIARFRCLSKFWTSIFVSYDFTEMFLTKSWTRPQIFFITIVDEELLVFSSSQPQNPYKNCSLVATRYKHSPQHVRYGILPNLIGVNPLICNLFRGESITLPNLKAKKVGLRSFLCYDQTNKQFKMLCCQIPNSTHWVLTLILDTTVKRCWRTSEYGPYSPYNDVTSGICINGLLYYRTGYRRPSIVCFDMRSEKFSFIKINVNDMFEDHYPWILTNYKGKLGLHSYCRHRSDKEFVLWILEDTEKHTWSKKVCLLTPLWKNTVDEINSYCRIVLTHAGEIMFSLRDLSNPFYVYYYSFEKKTFTKVEIKGFQELPHCRIQVVPNYVENIKFM